MLATHSDCFLEFLKANLDLTDDDIPSPGEWADVGNTIGALALRLDVLSVEQLARILDIQENEQDGTLFGQLAVRLGYLSQEQVDHLLRIQEFNRCLETAERLVIRSRMSMQTLAAALSHFFSSEPPGSSTFDRDILRTIR